MTSQSEYYDVSFLRPWVDFPFRRIDGYVDPNTGFKGCEVRFYRKSGWTKEKHGAKSWWVVEGHTAEGIFTRKAWADAVMNEPYLLNEDTRARKMHTFSSFEKAHHYLAEVCRAMHGECVLRNRGCLLGCFVPTEDAVASIASAAALRVAQAETGLTQDEIDDQSDGEPWRKGLSLVDCIALGVDYQPDEE
ncbi:hypothetical protein B0H16DRAFT_1478625 [Mycena metata]|uniref:Uncharacterized protein n=1 Tax=Mycena metata TaxID=1033252 RepID=A0AAD7H6F8_9AGAR|nr:hypothetical protein B0H16DRAFT_1478625 [Mycena metata]